MISQFRKLFACLVLPACLHSAYAANDYIVQTDLDTGLTYYIYVNGPDSIGEETGKVSSAIPIGSKGARFQLYGVGLVPDAKLYLLSETVVGAFLPQASVDITSADAYHVVARTRADESFFASMKFSNLLTSDNTAPESAKVVYVERIAMEYPEGEDRVSVTGASTERVIEAFYVTKNGELEGSVTTGLQSEFDHKQKGEEILRIYALPDQDLGWTVIDEKKIHVWPIADGSIKGVTADGTTYDLADEVLNYIPNISMSASDLYPTSQTSLRIYKGQKTDDATVESQVITKIVADDYDPLSFNTTVPQSASQLIRASQWEKYAKDDGVYTVEMVTVTPFNNGKPERMAYATFTLDRTVTVRGSVTTSE